ncbi:MAG: tetratricopeptide repeat protein [Woeseiaceae bacterium]
MSVWQELKDRSVVRVAAIYLAASWLMLQVADLLVDIYDLPEALLRWLGIILALGLPATLALSWVYQWTPQGLIRESDQPVDRRRISGRTISLTAIILTGLATAVYIVGGVVMTNGDGNVVATTNDRPAGSLAVIPFVNNSDSDETDYFADGLSSELLNLLASVPELRVTGRTSSFRYKGADVDPRTIGDELNVAHILEGEVRKAGDQLRISVQLIETATGFQVWRENFDRTISDVFQMQDEIAARTVNGLRVTLVAAPPTVATTDPEAFNLYLNASYHYALRSPENYDRALELVYQAIEIDDNFAPFWTLRSSTYSNQVIIGELEFEEGGALAKVASERALEIDPQFPFANAARAWHAMYFERDYATAGRFFQRALRLAPGNATILGNSAVYASTIGQLDRAEELTLAALVREPISPVTHLNYSSLLNRMGRHVESIDEAMKSLELRPGSFAATVNLCQAYILSEQSEEALVCADDIPSDQYRSFIRALANHSLGRADDTETEINALMRQDQDDASLLLARIYAWMGQSDHAFEWLERRIVSGGSIMGVKTDPSFRSLHSDQRWEDTMRALGLADDQVAEFRL